MSCALSLTGGEWRSADPIPPGRIGYFKMDEPCQLDGEFAYWGSELRDLKVRQMALSGIDESAPESLSPRFGR